MSDKCPDCGWALERFGVVRNCTRPDCTFTQDADEAVQELEAENERLAKKIALMGAMAGMVDKDEALRLIAKEAAKEKP